MLIPSATHKQVVLYFQVHQPLRLKQFVPRTPDESPDYFDRDLNKSIVRRVAERCYLPANKMLIHAISTHLEIRVCFSISGVALDQFKHYCPEVIESFQELAKTIAVEFLAETNYHSLASFVSADEFQDQILEHSEKLLTLFGAAPTVVRNTQLIYNDDIGQRVAELGFRGIVAEGIEGSVAGNPYQIHSHPTSDLKIFLLASSLSSEASTLFLQSEVNAVNQYVNKIFLADGPVALLGYPYEAFGEHVKSSSGVISFLESLIKKIVEHPALDFITPSELLDGSEALPVKDAVSWSDERKDLTAWFGNEHQGNAFEGLKALEQSVKKCGSMELLQTWRHLQSCSHFYYMSLKVGAEGGLRNYFSHYNSAQQAYDNYRRVLNDFGTRILIAVQNNNHVENWIDAVPGELNYTSPYAAVDALYI